MQFAIWRLLAFNRGDVDLSMHTGTRLLVLARKPAPVQVSYLAYAGTTGMTAIDYQFSDPYLDSPQAGESFHVERTKRLESYWCYQPPGDCEAVNPLPAATAGFVTFGCLNNFAKVNGKLVSAWASVLRGAPRSRMLVHAYEGGHRQRFLEQMRSAGVEPCRIEFVHRLSLADYFRLYRSIDIALDTFPYGGGTTTCDALWMGVPVVSWVGATPMSRAGLSLLSNLGLPELAGHSAEQFVRIALEWSQDLSRLAELRATLRTRMTGSRLTNLPQFVREIETAYRQMWRDWCAARGGG